MITLHTCGCYITRSLRLFVWRWCRKRVEFEYGVLRVSVEAYELVDTHCVRYSSITVWLYLTIPDRHLAVVVVVVLLLTLLSMPSSRTHTLANNHRLMPAGKGGSDPHAFNVTTYGKVSADLPP